MAAGKAWYSLISASPRPENGEQVNVGIILGNGQPSRLEYLEGLPRLAGLVRSDELALMQEVLRSAAARLQAGIGLEALRSVLGPQLRVSEPRGLLRQPTDDVAKLITLRYLVGTPRGERKLQEDVALKRQSEQELDRVVSRVARLGMEVVRNARFEKLYEKKPAWTHQVHIPPLARALRSNRRDILIDSVLVRPDKITHAIAVATSRIGRAFWYYSRLKGDIRSSAGRDVLTVGVLLDGAAAHAESAGKERDVLEAREYIKHTWKPDADLVVEVENTADLDLLRERVRWLVEAKS